MNNVVETINALADKFGIAVDWSSQNIIPYVQDLISRYAQAEMLKSFVWIVLSVAIIITAILISRKIWKSGIDDWDEDDVRITTVIVDFFVIGGFVLIFVFNIMNIINLGIFPEKAFIDLLLNK